MVKLYFCLDCKKLVIPTKDKKCPLCGGSRLTDKWEGLIIIIDPENSQIAKFKEIKEAGRYVISYREK